MPKSNYILIDKFSEGWQKREDPTRIPLGAAQKSVNITITDRGGISPRPGELLLGTYDSTAAGIKSMYSFDKSGGNPILVKTFSTFIDYYSNKTSDWDLLKAGYTSGQVFGFRENSINVEAKDLLYFGNAKENYQRWEGYENQLNGALVGAETSVIVDTVLQPDVHFSGTASSVTTTTLDVPAGTWATDIWNDFYIHITNGSKDTFISLITATTATKVTFGTISGLSGTPTYEIRQAAVPATGTLMYADTELAYTAISREDRFTVGSAHAGSDNAAITVIPTEYPAAPKGNVFETLFADMYVAGVIATPNTVFRSATADATDFTFASPRAADEGDVIYFPYKGGAVSDVAAQEDTLYVVKPNSVEALVYTKDANDLATITPVIQGAGVGTNAKTFRIDDDIAFATPNNRITTVGRILSRDRRPQIADLAYPIRREVETYDFSSVVGIEYRNRVFVAVKSSSTVSANDRVLCYNKDNKSWEGFWYINASSFATHNGNLYYGDGYTPNCYQMMVGINKVRGTNNLPISCDWQSGWINTRGTGFYVNEVSSLAVEGYITANTTIEFDLYKDFSTTPFQQLQLVGTETEYQDGVPTFSLLGGDPLGLEPLGAASVVGDEDSDGRRHFIIFLDFVNTPLEYVSIGVGSSGTGQNWEVTGLGINARENVFENQARIKT